MKGKCQQNFYELKVFGKRCSLSQKQISLQADSVIGQRTKPSKQYNVITSKEKEYFQVLIPILHILICLFFFWWKKMLYSGSLQPEK